MTKQIGGWYGNRSLLLYGTSSIVWTGHTATHHSATISPLSQVGSIHSCHIRRRAEVRSKVLWRAREVDLLYGWLQYLVVCMINGFQTVFWHPKTTLALLVSVFESWLWIEIFTLIGTYHLTVIQLSSRMIQDDGCPVIDHT